MSNFQVDVDGVTVEVTSDISLSQHLVRRLAVLLFLSADTSLDQLEDLIWGLYREDPTNKKALLDLFDIMYSRMQLNK